MATKTATRTCRTITNDRPAAAAKVAAASVPTAEQVAAIETWKREYALRCAKTALRFVQACNRWFLICDDLTAARQANDAVAEAAATAAWIKGRNPSKTAKYRAYDGIAAALSVLGITGMHCSTLADIEAAAALVRKVNG